MILLALALAIFAGLAWGWGYAAFVVGVVAMLLGLIALAAD